jgi:hypothetical protein
MEDGEPNAVPAQQLNEEGLPINPEDDPNETIPPEILADMRAVWSVF